MAKLIKAVGFGYECEHSKCECRIFMNMGKMFDDIWMEHVRVV